MVEDRHVRKTKNAIKQAFIKIISRKRTRTDNDTRYNNACRC